MIGIVTKELSIQLRAPSLHCSHLTKHCNHMHDTLNLSIDWKIHSMYSAQGLDYPHMIRHIHTPQ